MVCVLNLIIRQLQAPTLTYKACDVLPNKRNEYRTTELFIQTGTLGSLKKGVSFVNQQ